jgi:hypothetical protein
MLMNNIDVDVAGYPDHLGPATRPFTSLCQEADVFEAVEREDVRMPAREERAC